MRIRPISLREANEWVATNHRHHGPSTGHKFSISVRDEADVILGVAIVGRPVARHLDDGGTCEVLRLCTDGTPNACSMLYGAAARAAKAMGYDRIITYILGSESGGSLKASGYVLEAESKGGSWDRSARARTDSHPTCPKTRWGRRL